MKKLILSLICLVAIMVTGVQAAPNGGAVAFGTYSAASGSAVYSAVYNVRGFRTKTVQVQGRSTAHADTTLSGTVLIQCGPTTNGPWQTCTQSDRTAVSTTSNAILNWNDAAAYIRASWAKTAGQVSVWLNWVED